MFYFISFLIVIVRCYILKKVSDLSNVIKTIPGVNEAQIKSFVDVGKLIPSGRDLGHGLEIGRFKYDALITINSCSVDIAERIFSVIFIWLAENDENREKRNLADPEVDISVLDDGAFSMKILIEFDESFSIMKKQSGPIIYNGEHWDITDVSVDIADDLEKIEIKEV